MKAREKDFLASEQKRVDRILESFKKIVNLDGYNLDFHGTLSLDLDSKTQNKSLIENILKDFDSFLESKSIERVPSKSNANEFYLIPKKSEKYLSMESIDFDDNYDFFNSMFMYGYVGTAEMYDFIDKNFKILPFEDSGYMTYYLEDEETKEESFDNWIGRVEETIDEMESMVTNGYVEKVVMPKIKDLSDVVNHIENIKNGIKLN